MSKYLAPAGIIGALLVGVALILAPHFLPVGPVVPPGPVGVNVLVVCVADSITCDQVKPIVADLQAQKVAISIETVTDDAKYNTDSYPTEILRKGAAEIGRHVGVPTAEEIKAWLQAAKQPKGK
jgi:hypothetical protein